MSVSPGDRVQIIKSVYVNKHFWGGTYIVLTVKGKNLVLQNSKYGGKNLYPLIGECKII